MAPQMTRINLDFLVKHTKKITKITTEWNKTHTYTTQLTHIHRHTTQQHNSTYYMSHSSTQVWHTVATKATA